MQSENETGAKAKEGRRPYVPPELVLLRLRSSGDNVVGACKVDVGQATNGAPSATCDLCSSLGS